MLKVGTYYSGLYEKERTFTSAGAVEKEYHYIPTPSGTVAVHIKSTENPDGTTYFLLKDYLGSVWNKKTLESI